MKPTTLKERMKLEEDAIFEDNTEEKGMSDEDLKIESLKIATNIGKLMSNVTTEDIVSIAETIAKFIKGGENAALETTSDDNIEEPIEDENTADSEEDFDTEDNVDNVNNASEESTEENAEEDFEV